LINPTILPQLQPPASMFPSIITLGKFACDLVMNVVDLEVSALLAARSPSGSAGLMQPGQICRIYLLRKTRADA
jgi:hypothetical protein